MNLLDWDSVTNPAQLAHYCAKVFHETVGKNGHCRCGVREFQPWEVPLHDSQLVLVIESGTCYYP